MRATFADVRIVLRGLARRRGFTCAVLATLALGIGANTALFSVVEAVLIQPLPYPGSDRLAILWSDLTKADYRRAPISGPELDDLRRGVPSLAAVGSVWASSATLIDADRPEPLRVAMVTANFLSVLGVEPVLGSWPGAEHEGDGATPAVVLSGGLWQRRFGAGEDVVGRAVRIDGGWGVPGGLYTVVGVMPPDFQMLLPVDSGVPRQVDVWLPFQDDLASSPRGQWYLRTVARLAPGVSLERAAAEVESVGREIEAAHPQYAETGRAFWLVSLQDDLVRGVRPALLALLGATAFVLLIACANVAHLLLARAAERRREVSLRLAIGAGRWRVARLALVECLVLSALGCALGVGLALLGIELLPKIAPASLPRLDAVSLGLPVLGFSVFVSLACALIFGLAPLWAGFRTDPVNGLKADGRGGDRQQNRTHTLLVVAEVAVAVVVLAGAVLLVRSFVALQKVDPGFDAAGSLSFQLSLPRSRYPSPESIAGFSRELDRRLGELPGVEAAGAINQLPLSDQPNWSTPWATRNSVDTDEGGEADARIVTPGYLEAIGVRLLEGRLIEPADDENAQPVILVDESLARIAWPDASAVGQEMEVATGGDFRPRWVEVVGVVAHVRHHDPAAQVRGQVFAPFAQGPRNQAGVVVRSRVTGPTLLEAVRGAIHDLDPDLALARVRPLDDYVADAHAAARFRMLLATAMAALAVVLASLGLAGVLSLSVARRSRELGIRLALGGTPEDILRLVVGHGARLLVAGAGVGLLVSLAVNRMLDSLLFGVSSHDPATLLLAAAALLAVGLAASVAPARRAASTDPVVTLRAE